MKKTIIKEGFLYKLRPVDYTDAEFIVEIRNSDYQRTKYIHSVSNDLSVQLDWLKDYFERDNDYYFVIENRISGNKEGLISIYNIENKKAEWGRWIVKNGSLASVESVLLMYNAAFDDLNLDELYSRTIKDNISVVKFHEQINEIKRGVLQNFFSLDGIYYDAVEYYADSEYYYNKIKILLEDKSFKIFMRELDIQTGGLKFHHIGIASDDINKEYSAFRLIGYNSGSDIFYDNNQGIKGLFIESNCMPRLELLENLENSTTLNYFTDKKIKMYHFGYFTENIDKTKDILCSLGAKVISPIKKSTYFKTNICFLMLKNTFIIELIDNTDKLF